MHRIVVNRSATISMDFTFTPTGLPTVVVTRDDGTVVTTSSVAATADPSVFEYTIPAAQNTQLDELTETWTAVVSGQSQTFEDTIDVAGGTLFSVGQARLMKPLDNSAVYTDAKIIDARTMVESALEDLCSVAFVPRYRRVTVSGNGSTMLKLPAQLRRIRSVERDGTAIGDLSTIRVLPTGEAYYPSGWTLGFANYDVAFEHGYSEPGLRVAQAALLWAKTFLVKGPVDDRMTSMSTEDGTYTLATPGMRGSHTGIPEVDAVINEYNLTVAVA